MAKKKTGPTVEQSRRGVSNITPRRKPPARSSRPKKPYAAAAVLTADFGGVVTLAKVVGISGSYLSLSFFVLLMSLSLLVFYLHSKAA